jgi:hypothetical protein
MPGPTAPAVHSEPLRGPGYSVETLLALRGPCAELTRPCRRFKNHLKTLGVFPRFGSAKVGAAVALIVRSHFTYGTRSAPLGRDWRPATQRGDQGHSRGFTRPKADKVISKIPFLEHVLKQPVQDRPKVLRAARIEQADRTEEYFSSVLGGIRGAWQGERPPVKPVRTGRLRCWYLLYRRGGWRLNWRRHGSARAHQDLSFDIKSILV